MIIALDTEYTNLRNPRLVSIGMVAEGGDEFYAELPVDLRRCTPFIGGTVGPQLGHYPNALCQDDELLRTRLLAWLSRHNTVGDILLVFSTEIDWSMFCRATGMAVPACYKPSLLPVHKQNQVARWDFWRKHPGLQEHHALNDAKALLHSVLTK